MILLREKLPSMPMTVHSPTPGSQAARKAERSSAHAAGRGMMPGSRPSEPPRVRRRPGYVSAASMA